MFKLLCLLGFASYCEPVYWCKAKAYMVGDTRVSPTTHQIDTKTGVWVEIKYKTNHPCQEDEQ